MKPKNFRITDIPETKTEWVKWMVEPFAYGWLLYSLAIHLYGPAIKFLVWFGRAVIFWINLIGKITGS